jgi:hypothetical protein
MSTNPATPTTEDQTAIRAGLGPFGQYAECYRALGLQPRPIIPGTKACKLPGWQRPDCEISDHTFGVWLRKFHCFGIGLVMGANLPDGSTLGALDIDHDDYTRIGRTLLGDPVSGRFGKKGAVFFVRVFGDAKNWEFKVKGHPQLGKVAECLFTKKLCVIPPTVHPDTNQPYRWLGTALHEVPLDLLPAVEF